MTIVQASPAAEGVPHEGKSLARIPLFPPYETPGCPVCFEKAIKA